MSSEEHDPKHEQLMIQWVTETCGWVTELIDKELDKL